MASVPGPSLMALSPSVPLETMRACLPQVLCVGWEADGQPAGQVLPEGVLSRLGLLEE